MNEDSGMAFRPREMVYAAMMAVVISVCAWITVPLGDVPFTMQTFGVFCALALLGGKYGTLSILVYLLLGAVGLPVFSGFGGGIGKILGPTGGYLLGFLLGGLVYWLTTGLLGTGTRAKILAMVFVCIVYYAFGTAWYVLVYAGGGAVSVAAAITRCVLPYIIPDALKLSLALLLCGRVKRGIARRR